MTTVMDVIAEYAALTANGHEQPETVQANVEILRNVYRHNGNNALSSADLSNLRGVLGVCYAGFAHDAKNCDTHCKNVARTLYARA